MNAVYYIFSKAFVVVSHSIMIAKLVRYRLVIWTISNKVNGKLVGLLVLNDCNQ